eukprot:6186631-Pleurochrysis_carterae.AAC.4
MEQKYCIKNVYDSVIAQPSQPSNSWWGPRAPKRGSTAALSTRSLIPQFPCIDRILTPFTSNWRELRRLAITPPFAKRSSGSTRQENLSWRLRSSKLCHSTALIGGFKCARA